MGNDGLVEIDGLGKITDDPVRRQRLLIRCQLLLPLFQPRLTDGLDVF